MIVCNDVLADLVSQLKAQGKKIVFTNGCFDIIHSGHIIYLSEAKKLGDYLILGLNSDASVKRLKGKSRPVNSENNRATVLDALKSIDFVTVFEDDTPFKLISKLKPDVLVKGGDYSIENIVGADIVQANGGRVVTIPFVDGQSTTLIISKLNESNNE